MTPAGQASALPDLIGQVRAAPPAPPHRTWLRIGDACMEVATSHGPLLAEIEALYGDCAVASPVPGIPRLRCTAWTLDGGRILALSFDGPLRTDPLEAALNPYRFVRRTRYAQTPGPADGWRRIVDTEAGGDFLLASDGRTALVNCGAAPPEFVVDCIVAVAQGAQKDVLFLHAGSVGVGGRGALILGATGGGKSTLALGLAWRGHAFLGDDVAAVRMATRELVPLPKSAGLREGPLARLLAERVRAGRHVVAPNRHGMPRTLLRVYDLFPASASGPLPLEFAFLLDVRAARATITPYRPRLADARRLQSVVTDASSAWGLSPGRDLMNYLVVVDLLSRLRCHLLQPGPLEETARLIESAMEERCP